MPSPSALPASDPALFSPRILARSFKSIHTRHSPVHQHQIKRSPSLRSRLEGSQRTSPGLHRHRRHAETAHHVEEYLSCARIIIDDQNPAVHKRSSALPSAETTCGPADIAVRIVKKNVLPLPGSLSTHILPPIISTSCLQIARPSPVPPYLREICESAWVNARNNPSI